MSTILVVAAMDVERALLLSYLTDREDITLANGSSLNIGFLDGRKVGILLCGIGKVNATMGLTLALSSCQFDFIVNSGVAGGLLSEQNPGDMAIAQNVAYHDVDVCAFGYKYGQLPNGPETYLVDSNIANFLYNKSLEQGNKTFKGLIVSGDQFVNTPIRVSSIMQRFPSAVALEMEAAAIAHTCHSMNKPFAVIRAISDKADSDAKSDYGEFVADAAKKSALLVRELVKYLCKEEELEV